MPDAAAQNLAQYVSAAFVRRKHAVVDEKRCGASVVRNDAEAGVAHVICHARQLGGAGN